MGACHGSESKVAASIPRSTRFKPDCDIGDDQIIDRTCKTGQTKQSSGHMKIRDTTSLSQVNEKKHRKKILDSRKMSIHSQGLETRNPSGDERSQKISCSNPNKKKGYILELNGIRYRIPHLASPEKSSLLMRRRLSNSACQIQIHSKENSKPSNGFRFL